MAEFIDKFKAWEGKNEKIIREMTSILQTYVNTRM